MVVLITLYREDRVGQVAAAALVIRELQQVELVTKAATAQPKVLTVGLEPLRVAAVAEQTRQVEIVLVRLAGMAVVEKQQALH
jgi:exosortase/archaeosortase